jgi:hypothetical protein
LGCNCGNKNRVPGSNSVTVPGTFRVMVGGKQVYESSNKTAADAVAARFDNATILNPGETA